MKSDNRARREDDIRREKEEKEKKLKEENDQLKEWMKKYKKPGVYRQVVKINEEDMKTSTRREFKSRTYIEDNFLSALDNPITMEELEKEKIKNKDNKESPIDQDEIRKPKDIRSNMRAGQPKSTLFTSNHHLYNPSGIPLITNTGHSTKILTHHGHDRVSIFDYDMNEIENRNFSRKIYKRGMKKPEEKFEGDLLTDI